MTATLPTKVDLQEGSLVDFTGKHKSVSSNSLKIAKALNVKHSNVTRVIKRLIANSKISRLNCEQSEYINDRGKSYIFYTLDETASLQIVMGLSGTKAEQLHKDIAQAFVNMKYELAEWREQALLATDSTKQANDQIYLLQHDLAEAMPSSGKPKLLFIHIQTAINKAVTGVGKSIDRNTLHIDDLNEIKQLEQQVLTDIERLRREGIAPEKIRLDVIDMIKATGKEKASASDQTERNSHNAD